MNYKKEDNALKIGILSGKGGVGKTTLTASLAHIAHSENDLNLLVLDCDVDAPNLALILPARTQTAITINETFTTLKAHFLEEYCAHCKKCIDDHFCEFNALKWQNRNLIPEIDYLSCEGCGACKVLCPNDAFEIKAVKSGEIISYITESNFPLVYGKTRLGSTTSGKLVTETKDYAMKLLNCNKNNLLLIDGPPGIGCPVIATVSGLDYVITITEPTPSGLHDLIRVIEVIKQFEIPLGIVINKADIKSSFQKKFQSFIEETGYEILGKIPFDLNIAKAMSFAKPVVDYNKNAKASQVIIKIFKKIKDKFQL